MSHFTWRRFRPIHTFHERETDEIYIQAEQRAEQYVVRTKKFWRRREATAFDAAIVETRQEAERSNDPSVWLASLVVQTPRAVLAQKQMDSKGGGYRNRQARLFELIDFNDTFVSTVLSLPEEYLPGFVEHAKRLMDRFCEQTGYKSFSSEQWEAISHGLSREIAVYRTAIAQGFHARMTSRRDDAMGIDMVVTDPETGINLNLDVKTRSSFHFRLLDLQREGRITEETRLRAELQGYALVINGRGAERVHTTLLRIDHETYGAIEEFTIEKATLLRDMIKLIMKDRYERNTRTTAYPST